MNQLTVCSLITSRELPFWCCEVWQRVEKCQKSMFPNFVFSKAVLGALLKVTLKWFFEVLSVFRPEHHQIIHTTNYATCHVPRPLWTYYTLFFTKYHASTTYKTRWKLQRSHECTQWFELHPVMASETACNLGGHGQVPCSTSSGNRDEARGVADICFNRCRYTTSRSYLTLLYGDHLQRYADKHNEFENNHW